MFNRESAGPITYNLWDGQEKPYAKVSGVEEYEEETWGTRCVYNVTDQTLSVYPARGQNLGVGVAILPGGAYMAEAIDSEGHDVAKVLSDFGITAAVLKYRLPNPKTSDQPHMVPLTDTRKALKLLRQISWQFGFRRDKVGVLGFSAGSHLATVTSLWKSDDVEENPSFSGLMYGTTNLSDENLKWLEDSLYFRKLTPTEIEQNWLLDLVTPATPPAFLSHAYDDDVCKVEESTL